MVEKWDHESLGSVNMMRMGFSIMIFAGILMLVTSLFCKMQIWNVVLPIFIFYYGSTFIWPNAFSLAFTPFGHIADMPVQSMVLCKSVEAP